MCEEESGIPCLKRVAHVVEAEWQTKSHESLENFGRESNCFLTTEKAFQKTVRKKKKKKLRVSRSCNNCHNTREIAHVRHIICC